MTGDNAWTRCTVNDIGIEIRTRTDLESELATKLMDETEILGDVLDEL